MDFQLIKLYQAKEKAVHDKWVETKGFAITVEPVTMVDATSKLIQHDLDPFHVDIDVLNHKVGTIKSYSTSYGAFIVLVNSEFDYIPLSVETLVSNKSKNTLSGVFAWINGKPIPQKSKILFKDFDNMKFEVNQVLVRRGFTNVYKYSLVRV